MCTEHCPCWAGPAPSERDEHIFQAVPMYHQVNEAYLNRRNRTWNETTRAGRDLEPFHWTYDGLGFVTFEECLIHHFGGDNKTSSQLREA